MVVPEGLAGLSLRELRSLIARIRRWRDEANEEIAILYTREPEARLKTAGRRDAFQEVLEEIKAMLNGGDTRE